MGGECKKVVCDSPMLRNHHDALARTDLNLLRDFAKAKDEGLFTDEEFRAIKWEIFGLSSVKG